MIDKAPKRTMGELRLLVLGYPQKHGPMTASNLGAMFWGDCTRQGATNRKPQAFARPASKVLLTLKKDGLVTCDSDGRLWLWRLVK